MVEKEEAYLCALSGYEEAVGNENPGVEILKSPAHTIVVSKSVPHSC